MMVYALPKVKISGKWYFQDDRLREFRRINNPHQRITFNEFDEKDIKIEKYVEGRNF